MKDKKDKKVLSTAEKKAGQKQLRQDVSDYLLGIAGGLIYAATINLVVLPHGLYIGNLTGIARILQELLHLIFPNMKDLTGLFLLGLNLPLMIISFKSINRKFFFKTVVIVATMTLALQFIPVKAIIPGLDDLLTISLLGGILSGFGAGLALQSGGSAGGTDILGVFVALKNKNFSVGRVNLMISLAVYVYALFKYPPVILVYSVIFTLIYTMIVDRVHLQNVKVSLMIVTHNRDVLSYITTQIGRGATYWDGAGAYSHQPLLVVNTVVSKYEVTVLRRGVMELDPQAFLIENPEVNVSGFFPSHFF